MSHEPILSALLQFMPEAGIQAVYREANLAEFIVIDHNIFDIPVEELKETQVDLTTIGVEVVFSRNWRHRTDTIGRRLSRPINPDTRVISTLASRAQLGTIQAEGAMTWRAAISLSGPWTREGSGCRSNH